MSSRNISPAYALILFGCVLVGSAGAHCAGISVGEPDAGRTFANGSACRSGLELALNEDAIDVGAMNQLGIRYARGRGVAKNYSIAVKWFRRSAREGYPPAMANLGTMYQVGEGLHRSYRKAYVWLHVALAFGVPAEDHDATVFRLGMIASHLSPTGIARATRVAENIAERLSKRESGPAAGPATAYSDWGYESNYR